MTNEEIDALEPGLELDALVAEIIFKTPLAHYPGSEGGGMIVQASEDHWAQRCWSWSFCRWCGAKMPNGILSGRCVQSARQNRYSTQIQDAWRIVEKLHLHVGWYDLGWYASTKHDFNEDDCLIVFAETVPLSVCRLALKVVNA